MSHQCYVPAYFGIADQFAFLHLTCQARLTLQGQDHKSCLQEWQGHEDPYALFLEYVFRLLHVEVHHAYGAAGQPLGEMHAMANHESFSGVHQNSSHIA